MLVIELLLVLVLSYLIGSINLSIIISKAMGKGDIREQGSKNAGTTNVLRVLGKGPALMVFVWDVLKGVIAILLARGLAYLCFPADATTLVVPEEFNMAYAYGIMLATFGVVLGHNFPVYFGFKGGKGVATSLGCILAIEPQIGLVCLVAGVSMVALFNMVSIGSIIAAIIYPICIIFMGGSFDKIFNSNAKIRLVYIVFAFIMAFSVIFRHKANIKRIRNGTENKLFKSKEEKFEEAKNFSEEEKKEDIQEETKEETKVEEPKIEEAAIKFEPVKEEKEPKKKK